MPDDVVLALFSDLHLCADPSTRVMDVDPTRAFAAALDALESRPHAVLLTGDIADDASRAAYEQVASMTAAIADEVYVIPGNHDDRGALGEVFGPIAQVSVTRLSDAWSLVLVDSSDPARIGGRVDAATIDKLDALLAHQPNIVVAIHHPLRPPCGFSECGLEGSEALEAVLAKHAVRLVVSGHLHHQFDTRSSGIRCFGARSTLRELLHGDTPSHWVPGDGPVGLARLTLGASGSCSVESIESAKA
jgi:Icc protein